jgi:hypothetical protein
MIRFVHPGFGSRILIRVTHPGFQIQDPGSGSATLIRMRKFLGLQDPDPLLFARIRIRLRIRKLPARSKIVKKWVLTIYAKGTFRLFFEYKIG